LTPEQTSQFLDGAIRNRIAVRLIAEQHIALSRALQHPDLMKDRVGVIDLKCRPIDLIRCDTFYTALPFLDHISCSTCGSFVKELCSATMGASPEIVVDGSPDAAFAYVDVSSLFYRFTIHPRYVPVHLEYIITEILKNSFRATVENHYKRNGSSTDIELPPVVITVSPGRPQRSTNPPYLSLRIRDQGGGVPRQNMRRIFSYAFTTAENTSSDDDGADGDPCYAGGNATVDGKSGSDPFAEITRKGIQTGLGTFYGLGYGLPMSGLYAR
jgi:26S proteasome regulatory subunit T1